MNIIPIALWYIPIGYSLTCLVPLVNILMNSSPSTVKNTKNAPIINKLVIIMKSPNTISITKSILSNVRSGIKLILDTLSH